MKKTIIAVILCLGLLVVFGAAAVGGEPAETGKKGRGCVVCGTGQNPGGRRHVGP